MRERDQMDAEVVVEAVVVEEEEEEDDGVQGAMRYLYVYGMAA